jgi:S1-C subfamily serine protease
VTPGIPGDSGSAVLDADGKALGILVTVAIAPLAGSNGVSDLDKVLAYANANGGVGTLNLANGTGFDAHEVVPGLPGLPL